MSYDSYIYNVPFPHCDHYPTLQNVRINNAIPFSGEGGSPDEKNRPREVIDRWGGNRAVKCNHIPVQNRGATMNDGSFLCSLCKSWVQPRSIRVVSAWIKKEANDKGRIVPDQLPDSRYGSSDAAFDYLAKGDEVGCQINLTNGEHYGPCKGSCGPEKDPLTAVSEYLESEAHRWETEHTPHHPGGQCDFRDGVVSGYRWAKTKLDDALDMI